MIAVTALTMSLYATRGAHGSDHQDSPAMLARPGADITDVFLFPSPTNPANVVFAMDVHPLIPTGLGRNTSFDPAVMYQFKIGVDDHYTEDLVMQVKAEGSGTNQKLTLYGPARPNIVGTQSTWIAPTGGATYDISADLPKGIKLYGGPRQDPFYFDLPQFFKIIPDRNYKNQPNPPPPSAMCFRPPGQATDFLVGFNVLQLVVEVPRSLLAPNGGTQNKIHVWATTSVQERPGDVAYTQIERLARPAIKEAFEMFKDHDRSNRSSPYDDPLLAASIHDFTVHTAGRSEEIAQALVKVLIPDEIEADLGASGPARYLAVETNGKSGLPIAVIRAVPPSGIEGIKKALGDPVRHFGGRDPLSPVIDLSLGSIFGSLVPKLGLAHDDGHETACLTSDNVTPAGKHPLLANFPYFGNPW